MQRNKVHSRTTEAHGLQQELFRDFQMLTEMLVQERLGLWCLLPHLFFFFFLQNSLFVTRLKLH